MKVYKMYYSANDVQIGMEKQMWKHVPPQLSTIEETGLSQVCALMWECGITSIVGT